MALNPKLICMFHTIPIKTSISGIAFNEKAKSNYIYIGKFKFLIDIPNLNREFCTYRFSIFLTEK
jgi:hypothetical protein